MIRALHLQAFADRHKAERLREAGLSLSAISKQMKVSKSSIHRMLG